MHDHHRASDDHQASDHSGASRPERAGEHRKLVIAMAVAVVATVAEGVGGWLSHSLALLSDAGHMLADAAAIGLSLFALRIAGRPSDAKRKDGYYPLEILAPPGERARPSIVGSPTGFGGDGAASLLGGAPRHIPVAEVSSAIENVPGVAAVHDLHVWTITSGLIALSCHIVVTCEGPDCRSHDEILTEAKAVLRDRFAIEHTTIQFESDRYQHEEVIH